MTTPNIPQNYEEWRHCIVVGCGIELTPGFIKARIASLQNKHDSHTQQFIRLYGQQHHQKVLEWFMQAQSVVAKM